MNFKNNIVLILFLLSFSSLMTQTKFYAKGNSEGSLDQYYQISYILEGASGQINLPKSYPGFEIYRGPMQSSNYSNINGAVTRSFSVSYYLRPLKVGTFTIPKATIKIGNSSMATKPFKVTIKKGATKQTNTQVNQNNSQNTTDWKEKIKDFIFVKMSVDKTSPYVGEQVTLSLKLYVRGQAYQTQITEMPEFKGFWIKDFELNNHKWKQEEYNGQVYNTILINKYALFAQREGSFTLSPIKLQTVVQIPKPSKSNSVWDQFFRSYENKQYNFQSSSININVKPLPKKDVPLNFSGAVGVFKFKASIDSANTETGKAITLTTQVVGTGNIMMIDAPELIMPKSFEVYDPTVKEYISKKSYRINGSKKYNYLIIPEKPGHFILDSIPFSYFDLKKKKYKTIYTKNIKVNVAASANYKEEIVEENDILNGDIKLINKIYDFENKKKSFLFSTGFWVLWLLPSLLFILLIFIKNRKDNYKPDLVAINRKKANKLALLKLKGAAIYLQQNDRKAFYNEIIRALWDYVSFKLNIKPEDLNKDNISEKLLAQEVSETTIFNYIDLIKKSEMSIYSPIEETEMQNDFEAAKEIIIFVENEIIAIKEKNN